MVKVLYCMRCGVLSFEVDRDELNPKATADSSRRRQYPLQYVIEQVHSWLVSKDRRPWNKAVYWFDLTDIYVALHPATEDTVFLSVMKHLPRLTIFWARILIQVLAN